MKILSITLILATSFAFGQSFNQVKQLFNKSENRIFLKIPKTEFQTIYNQAKCISKEYGIPIKEMPIFQITKTDDFISLVWRQTLFGLGDTTFPKYKDNGELTVTCNAFKTPN